MATFTNEDRRYLEKLSELNRSMAKVHSLLGECMLYNTQHFGAVKKSIPSLKKEYEKVYMGSWVKMRDLAEKLERQR